MTDNPIMERTAFSSELSRLLTAAVAASGRPRCDIAQQAAIHKDAFRRVLSGARAVTMCEASRILIACGLPPQPYLSLVLAGHAQRGIDWIDAELGGFLDEFGRELPLALERALGNQLHEIKARWAKGTAHRVAKLLSDHMDELERRDTLYLDTSRS